MARHGACQYRFHHIPRDSREFSVECVLQSAYLGYGEFGDMRGVYLLGGTGGERRPHRCDVEASAASGLRIGTTGGQEGVRPEAAVVLGIYVAVGVYSEERRYKVPGSFLLGRHMYVRVCGVGTECGLQREVVATGCAGHRAAVDAESPESLRPRSRFPGRHPFRILFLRHILFPFVFVCPQLAQLDLAASGYAVLSFRKHHEFLVRILRRVCVCPQRSIIGGYLS